MKWKNHILPIFAVLFLALNILYPAQALLGAKKGLTLFLESILPALLPFFAATTIFIRTGMAHKSAKFMSPLMRPLFRLPGSSALSFILACFGGNPNGSRATAEMFEHGLLTKVEAERTIALASTAGPAFILSVVAAGMLKAPQYGVLLWCCHVLSSIATCQVSQLIANHHAPPENGKKTTLRIKHQSPSQIFVDSVRDCAVSLWGVGSFIIFFATLTSLCQSVGLFTILSKPISLILRPFGFSAQLAEPLVRGVMEITDGCSAVSTLSLPIAQKLPMLCFILSFGGFSALAQNHLFAKKCGMRLSRLTLYYTIQGIFGLFFTTIALRFFPVAQEAYAPIINTFKGGFLDSATWLLYAILVILGIGCILAIFSKLFGKFNSKHRPTRIDS